MNRLWLRLSISFMLITWVVTGVVAVLTRDSVQTNFGHFLNTSNSVRFGPNLVTELEAYYTANGSWHGVETLMSSSQGEAHEGGQGNRQGQGAQIFVADERGLIVSATNPDWLGQTVDAIGPSRTVALTHDGQVIGLLGEQTPGTIALNAAEEQFLEDTTAGLLLTALSGGVLALAVGVLVARGLTRPLQKLTKQVGHMTVHDLGQPIEANGTAEIAQLAAAFNSLSSRLADEEQRRRRMTADVAHELRTPVTVMRGHVEAMMDGVYPMDVQHLAVAYDQVLHLAHLVEDLRLLTRAEAGKLPLNKTVTAPGDLITRAAQRFQPLADDASVQLQAMIGRDLPAVQVDVDRMQQVLDNLLTNALRHTPPQGRITLSAQTTDQEPVCISVQNTGTPISADDAEHLFDRFWRAEEARERDAGGTGLGLAITKQLVLLHGGTIQAIPDESGTTFRLVIPAATTRAESAHAGAS